MKIPATAPLRRQAEPFDDPDWIYEIKHDGFRALAVIEQGRCRFVSRKHQPLSGFQAISEALVQEVKARTAILDGELVVADEHGRTVFASMMKRGRHDIRYFAFDLLWLNGIDLREVPLLPAETDSTFPLCPCSVCGSYDGRRPMVVSVCL